MRGDVNYKPVTIDTPKQIGVKIVIGIMVLSKNV